MKAKHGIDSMPETAENVAAEFKVSRADQDAYAMRSQQRYAKAKAAGFFAAEIVPVTLPQKKGEALVVKDDEHPRRDQPRGARASSRAWCAKTAPSPLATHRASTTAPAHCYWPRLQRRRAMASSPRARVLAMATAGVPPRIMGFGPAPGDAQGPRERPV